MPRRPTHRDAIVNAAAVLFRRNGYSATGINEIVAQSGAPKGSLYHYFPGGKDQIGEEAVRFAGERVRRTLAKLADAHDAAGLIRAYAELLAGWMAKSGFRDGCPITTTLLETAPGSTGILQAGREAFDAWRAVIAQVLERGGITAERARRLASFAVSALEGALIQARVEQDARPLIDMADELAGLFEAAASATPPTRRVKAPRSPPSTRR